jgi:hypothetical protein
VVRVCCRFHLLHAVSLRSAHLLILSVIFLPGGLFLLKSGDFENSGPSSEPRASILFYCCLTLRFVLFLFYHCLMLRFVLLNFIIV